MLVLYSNDHQLHDPRSEYYDGSEDAYAERAARVNQILKTLVAGNFPLREVVDSVDTTVIAKLHSTHYIHYLQNQCAKISDDKQIMPTVFIRDTNTPVVRGTYKAAIKSASIAIDAAQELLQGNESVVYALCRPPGHHAENDAMSGYCYFNNAALAAEKLAQGGRRVAVLDIDYHHGNGTQQLFYERSDVLYISIHADPEVAFPYRTGYADELGKDAGQGYNFNFTLPKTTTAEEYLSVLDTAIAKVTEYKPDYLVISLGFDAYKHDTLTGGLGLDEADYTTIGNTIAQRLPLPTVVIQEGGYNVEKLGDLAVQFITGYEAGKNGKT